MAALETINLDKASILADQSFLRELIGEAFWKWYANNLHVKVTTIRIWIIRKDIYVGDLESLFVLLFGKRPL